MVEKGFELNLEHPAGPDFVEADFASFAGKFKKVLILTSSAIDKVTYLPKEFIENLLAIAPRIAVMSFEYVGCNFQMSPLGRSSFRERFGRRG